MSLDDYERITLTQFFNKLNGFYELALQKEQNEWDRVNYLTYSIMLNNPHIKERDKPKTFDAYLGKKVEKKVTSTIKSAEEFEKKFGIR